MPSEDTEDTMGWETAQRIFRIGMILSFLVAALGILSEFLGWWNDTGEVLATVGSLSGLVLGTISVLANASQSQVAGVAESVEGVADGVERANETLEAIDDDLDKLDDIDAGLDRQTDLLTQIRGRL